MTLEMRTVYWLALLLNGVVFGQTIMFDDFNYSDVDDAALTSFNKWQVVNGLNGPPSGAIYDRDNIGFEADPLDANNSIMTLQTTVDGISGAQTHARIQTQGYEYFEGTYAARVYFTDIPHVYEDANIQTFYTIVGSDLSGDGTQYSELDFEYMASDKWGISPNNEVVYLTSWNRYIADPWQAWKRYWADQESYEGWHTFVVSCTDGINVNYYIDGTFITSMATTDNDGTSVYPRSEMQVAFANWIWNSVIGSSTDDRNAAMKVDWVLFQKDTDLSPNQVEALVAGFKQQGLIRQNLVGDMEVVTSHEELKEMEEVEIFPNPVVDDLFMKTAEDDWKVSISGLDGKEVFTGHFSDGVLDLSNLKKGVYMMKIEQGSEI